MLYVIALKRLILFSFVFERCTKYSRIPPECVLIQDTTNPCCQVPYCDFKNPSPFPNGVPTPTSLAPTARPGVPTVAPLVPPTMTTTLRPVLNPSSTLAPPSSTLTPQGR